MSELINNTATGGQFTRQLLATASSLALVAIAAQGAQAQDEKHPTVWIEVGAQLERIDSDQAPFAPAFATKSFEPYNFVSPLGSQRPARYAVGGDLNLIFTPDHSDWVFQAGIRYGRANSTRNLQHQSNIATPFPNIKYKLNPTLYPTPIVTATGARFSFAETRNRQTHAVLDFQAGKDVGLGVLGGSSVISAGVRYAAFNTKSDVRLTARPTVTISKTSFLFPSAYVPITKHPDYFMSGHVARSFQAIGPSLAWSGSAPFLGSPDSVELIFDWGVNGALLFGRQKASGTHETNKALESFSYFQGDLPHIQPVYSTTKPFNRSRSVVVPNVGALAGLSFRYANAKVSFGYRADFFFGAMDTGIDVRRTGDVNFHGPFAKVSIGLGG
jgi:hypothetical protein